MLEIKQIVDQSFIDRLKNISVILEKMSQLETELNLLNVNVELEIRINTGNS